MIVSNVSLETQLSLESLGTLVALEPLLLVVDLPDVALESLLGAQHDFASWTSFGRFPQVDDVDVSLEIIPVFKPTTASFALPRRRLWLFLDALV